MCSGTLSPVIFLRSQKCHSLGDGGLPDCVSRPQVRMSGKPGQVQWIGILCTSKVCASRTGIVQEPRHSHFGVTGSATCSIEKAFGFKSRSREWKSPAHRRWASSFMGTSVAAMPHVAGSISASTCVSLLRTEPAVDSRASAALSSMILLH